MSLTCPSQSILSCNSAKMQLYTCLVYNRANLTHMNGRQPQLISLHKIIWALVASNFSLQMIEVCGCCVVPFSCFPASTNRFTQRNSCYISKCTMKHMQKSE